jgi:hypothetical protein
MRAPSALRAPVRRARLEQSSPTAENGAGLFPKRLLRSARPLPNHDAVTIDRSKSKFAHSPRLVANGLRDIGAAAARW